MRTSWELNKKSILNDMMQFDAGEASVFWPMYDKYMKSWSKLINERVYTIQKYCDEFTELSASQMSKFMKELFSNDLDLNKLQQKTYKKANKVLSHTRASEFMQIEYTFQLVLISEMQQRAMTIGDSMMKL